jgi:mono/diheme cytochrome c family protein
MRGRVVVIAVSAAVAFGLALSANEKPPETYQKAMKDLGAANQSLRNNVTAKDYEAIAKDAGTFKASFAVAETFWTQKNVEDAVKLVRDGSKAAGDLETAAKAKNEEGVTAAQRAVGGTCAACHMAHRERLADGSYEIK